MPLGIREAAYGVGATRWEVMRSQVLPVRRARHLTGAVLSLARAIGETAPLILVGAVTGFLPRRERGRATRARSGARSRPCRR